MVTYNLIKPDYL